nr:response regulator [Aeromicrobium marinum]
MTPPGAPRVVVAEDEALIRLDLVEMLRDEGYDVVGEAGDGERAVALTAELLPDVVLMDITMPRLDGIEAAAQIAGRRLAPVVLLTAFSQRELVDRAREAGAMAYLVKPFQQSDLPPAIEMARSRFAEITALAGEVDDLTEQLAARKAVERAKSLLQESFGISEAESFRWIQKAAMDLRLSMREVAEQVIDKGTDIARG